MTWVVMIGVLVFFLFEHKNSNQKTSSYLQSKLNAAVLEGDQELIDFYTERLARLR